MTLDQCVILWIGTLTGCPLCRESHPLCRLKNPTVISIWLLVGFRSATRSVQCTPAGYARKRAPGSIKTKKEKERKKRFGPFGEEECTLIWRHAFITCSLLCYILQDNSTLQEVHRLRPADGGAFTVCKRNHLGVSRIQRVNNV